jgi:hypothetical protein
MNKDFPKVIFGLSTSITPLFRPISAADRLARSGLGNRDGVEGSPPIFGVRTKADMA